MKLGCHAGEGPSTLGVVLSGELDAQLCTFEGLEREPDAQPYIEKHGGHRAIHTV